MHPKEIVQLVPIVIIGSDHIDRDDSTIINPWGGKTNSFSSVHITFQFFVVNVQAFEQGIWIRLFIFWKSITKHILLLCRIDFIPFLDNSFCSKTSAYATFDDNDNDKKIILIVPSLLDTFSRSAKVALVILILIWGWYPLNSSVWGEFKMQSLC